MWTVKYRKKTNFGPALVSGVVLILNIEQKERNLLGLAKAALYPSHAE